MATDKTLRKHVIDLLNGGGAHLPFDAATKDVPAALRGERPEGSEHSPWEILEHMRIALWDILEFTRNPKHVSPEFPAGYWPSSQAPPDGKAWDKSRNAFQADLEAFIDLVADESTDLLTPLPHGDGSANVIFATGYTVSVAGPIDVNPTYGKLAAPDSPNSKNVPVMAATAPAPPPLPPLPHLGPSPGEITAIAVGSLAAVAVTGIIWYHNRDFLMEAGTPVEISLSSPLVLDESNVTAAVQQFSKAPPEIVKPPRRMRTCWTPVTSGYPSTPYPCPY